MEPLVYTENIVTEHLNEWANIVESCEEAMDIIKEYKDITKTNKKNIMFFTYQEGKVFRKFKENKKYKSLAEQYKITQGTIIFQVNDIVKLVEEYIY